MRAEEAASQLAEIAYLLREREDHYRARAFSKAAAALLNERPDLDSLRKQNRLDSIPAVGAGIARTLAELVDHGTSPYLTRLREQDSDEPASGLDLAGYRGDLHTHSDWSDGKATLIDMALAAAKRGYEYLAVTDHSPRLTIVHGLDPQRLIQQRRLIDDVNPELDGLTVLQGCEVDILEDGSLDLPDEALAALDIVIVSPHIKLRQEPAAMTQRMLRAVSHPHVNVLGHPTGRRPGSRPGAQYDFAAVFKLAAQRGVVMEIDCDPARMDLSVEHAKLALGLGCDFSFDSDAHHPDELVYPELGLWSARRAGIPSERMLNWLPLAQLREVLQRG
ncbi:MAG: PHP domain-containing protein [Candidatus Dormibacter sp.]|uniref:PHP domain-containing protein n=1 Tax=Candidatus Dormibacter sp. TaxID=2973982 RepID=UPI000DAFFCD1|nr:MAG: PHP domain-containing protein [Candidatus Dormibacteraeota bacterium]